MRAADAGAEFASGIAVETSGDFVLADPDTAAVKRWDPGLGAGMGVSTGALLEWPSDLTVDDDGDLLVVDPDTNDFARVDPASGAQAPAGPASIFLYPTGLAYVPEASLLVQLATGLAALAGIGRSRRSRVGSVCRPPPRSHSVWASIRASGS
jgi:hypothetical protein